jgi:hypothetical protein
MSIFSAAVTQIMIYVLFSIKKIRVLRVERRTWNGRWDDLRSA